ncbi:MAG: YfgM family protein [Hydrogenophaga sp.]
MASHLDLEEQEQIAQLKHFWAQYGNLITWVLIVVLGAFAAWNGWSYWQRGQAVKASAMYDEMARAASSGDANRVRQALSDIQGGFSGSAFADQAALLAAKTLADGGQEAAARAALQWVADQSADDAYRALARLRLAGLDIQAQAYEQALQTLKAPVPKAFEALVSDRRGDVYMAQGKPQEARQQYESAWRSFAAQSDYRNLVEVKLAALGVDVNRLGVSVEAVR